MVAARAGFNNAGALGRKLMRVPPKLSFCKACLTGIQFNIFLFGLHSAVRCVNITIGVPEIRQLLKITTKSLNQQNQAVHKSKLTVNNATLCNTKPWALAMGKSEALTFHGF